MSIYGNPVTMGGSGGGSNHLVFDVLLQDTAITATGTKSLSSAVEGYDAVLVEIDVGDRKTYLIPVSDLPGHSFDVSWNATDSTSWYVVCCVSFSGSTMNITRFSKAGFSAASLKVYGVSIG